MNQFITHQGQAVAVYQPNIDTDQIIPKQFLKRIERTGFGEFLFYDWRFDADGKEIADFPLNQPQFKDASILLGGANFGCGSSREHAPWALEDFGFRVVVAPSFADIFYNNCCKVGILPVVLPEERVAELVQNVENQENYQLTIDLENRQIYDTGDFHAEFSIDEFRRFCLLNGLDDIGLSLQNEGSISTYEQTRPAWKVALN
jgi:3-isopropylmalate/(R)-2-methylmalate dehydratase small subunit